MDYTKIVWCHAFERINFHKYFIVLSLNSLRVHALFSTRQYSEKKSEQFTYNYMIHFAEISAFL